MQRAPLVSRSSCCSRPQSQVATDPSARMAAKPKSPAWICSASRSVTRLVRRLRDFWKPQMASLRPSARAKAPAGGASEIRLVAIKMLDVTTAVTDSPLVRAVERASCGFNWQQLPVTKNRMPHPNSCAAAACNTHTLESSGTSMLAERPLGKHTRTSMCPLRALSQEQLQLIGHADSNKTGSTSSFELPVSLQETAQTTAGDLQNFSLGASAMVSAEACSCGGPLLTEHFLWPFDLSSIVYSNESLYSSM